VRRAALVGAGALVAAAAVVVALARVPRAPAPSLAPLTLDGLRAEFNAAADRPRLVALLSPT
jgi:hypothetical protein